MTNVTRVANRRRHRRRHCVRQSPAVPSSSRTCTLDGTAGPYPGGSGLLPRLRPLPPGSTRRAAAVPPHTPKHSLSLFWVTDTSSTEHAVRADDMAASVADQLGEYPALCGATFQPAALTQAPVTQCARCAAMTHVEPTKPRGRHRAD